MSQLMRIRAPPEEATWRKEVQSFLESELPRGLRKRKRRSRGQREDGQNLHRERGSHRGQAAPASNWTQNQSLNGGRNFPGAAGSRLPGLKNMAAPVSQSWNSRS